MIKEFYIFRHGETDWNKSKRIQGHTNTRLNSTGINQAKQLVELLSNKSLEIIYSSDLDRAFQTAEIINQNLNLPIIKTNQLREAHFGEAEGMLLDDIIEKWGLEFWEKFRTLGPKNQEIGFPGGETRGDSVKRMRAFIDSVIKETEHAKIGISTHGGVVRNLLHSFLDENHTPLPIPNCVCYLLKYDPIDETFSVEGPLNSGENYF